MNHEGAIRDRRRLQALNFGITSEKWRAFSQAQVATFEVGQNGPPLVQISGKTATVGPTSLGSNGKLTLSQEEWPVNQQIGALCEVQIILHWKWNSINDLAAHMAAFESQDERRSFPLTLDAMRNTAILLLGQGLCGHDFVYGQGFVNQRLFKPLCQEQGTI